MILWFAKLDVQNKLFLSSEEQFSEIPLDIRISHLFCISEEGSCVKDIPPDYIYRQIPPCMEECKGYCVMVVYQ